MGARFPLAVVATLTTLIFQASAAPARQTSSLFSSYEVIAFKLEAPFNDLFAHARTRTSAEYGVSGTLTYTDGGHEVTVDGVKVSVRGNTSRRETECAFPKLKIQLPAGAPASALLSGITSLKIGTHCGESAGDSLTAKYGRLSNQQSPLREAFVYRLLESVGVPTLKARPAKLTYVYADALPGQSPPQEQPIVRNAMLLEDVDEAVKRFGGVREIEEKAFTNAKAQFTAADTARIAFAEAMIGNFDWCLKMTADDAYRCNARHPLWNIIAAASADGKARPLMHDFDVAGMVAGSHAWFKTVFNGAFVPSGSQTEVEVLAQVQRTRALFSRAELDAARADFVKRKSDAYRALAGATIDAAGKRRAQEYLDAFYMAIGSDDAFYRPVVTTEGARLYANKDRAVVCSSRGVIPVGTPVSAPLQTDGTVIQVHVLDALWYWAEPARCPAVREGPVWIDADAVSKDFPK